MIYVESEQWLAGHVLNYVQNALLSLFCDPHVAYSICMFSAWFLSLRKKMQDKDTSI